MPVDFRILIAVIANWMVIFLCASFNHALSSPGVYLSLTGLFVFIPALQMSLLSGFITASITGALLDSLCPLPFGFHFVMLNTLLTAIYCFRHGIRRMHRHQQLAIALLCNSFSFLAVSLKIVDLHSFPGQFWQRVFIDFLFSQLAALVIFSWFYSAQTKLFWFFGYELRKDDAHT